MSWQIQEAKNKLSEVVQKTLQTGPQVISKHGTDIVVMLSIAEYKKMRKGKTNIVDFFRKSPLVGKINLDRNKDATIRKCDL